MEITNVTEYEAIAKEKLPKMAFDYYASGAEDQWTLAQNRDAFTKILYVFSVSFFKSLLISSKTPANNLNINPWFDALTFHFYMNRLL